MTNEKLIKHLKDEVGVLKCQRLEQAIRAVDRADFVPENLRDEAYEDYPLPIGFGATISQPTTVAFMLEKLDVMSGQKVLDVGSGSGWTTALLAHLVGETGKVIGLEIIPELVTLGQQNLSKFYSQILENLRIELSKAAKIKQARRGSVGLPDEAPYDRILVSAAARNVPKELINQLKPDGILVLPVNQSILRIRKKPDNAIETEEYPGFVFVPLR